MTPARIRRRRRRAAAAAGRRRGASPRLRRARASCARRPRRRSASATGRSRPACRSIAAVEKGYFKEAGLDVEPLKFAGAQQVMEAMLSGRSRRQRQRHRLGQPRDRRDRAAGPFKIFCTNPSNAKNVLDEFIVPEASPVKTMADLKGKRVASGPGIQNVTLAKTMLERAGATGATRHRTADRPARRGARRRPGRCRATRSSRPARSAA